MHLNSAKRLYRPGRLGVIVACAAPVTLLGLAWLVVTQVLMVPAIPDQTAPADQVIQFIMHDKGLARLDRQRRETFLRVTAQRLIGDQKFRERFAAEYRVSSSEEQQAFREHLFDTLKPIVMDDVRGYHQQPEAARQKYLDERIVAYNRLSRLLEGVRLDLEGGSSRTERQEELLGLLLRKTTEQERELGLAYLRALLARVEEILADPTLKAEFEARIASPHP